MGKVDGVTAFKQGLTVKKQVKKRRSSSLQEWGVEEVREGGCLKGCSRKALYEIRPEYLEETKWLPLPPRIPLCFFPLPCRTLKKQARMHRSRGWRKASKVGTWWLREKKKGTWRRRHRPHQMRASVPWQHGSDKHPLKGPRVKD